MYAIRSYYGNTACYGDVIIPSQIEGYPVTKIGFGAFADIDSSQTPDCNSIPIIPNSNYFYDSEESDTIKASLLSNTYNKSATS